MRGKKTLFAVVAALMFAAVPVTSQASPSKNISIQKPKAQKWQCVPFARLNSDITLRGDAWRWWKAAEGLYERGPLPQVGSVMVFKQHGKMKRGHVAVIDVSDENDWSQVRVWYDPVKDLGSKSYPIYGFIYSPSEDGVEITMATDAELPMKGERLEADPTLALDSVKDGDLAVGESATETP